MKVTPIECLSDNYAYIINDFDSKIVGVVDPSEAAPIIKFLEKTQVFDKTTRRGSSGTDKPLLVKS